MGQDAPGAERRGLSSTTLASLAIGEGPVKRSAWLLLPHQEGFEVPDSRGDVLWWTSSSAARRECVASKRVRAPEYAQRRNKEISVTAQNNGRKLTFNHDRPNVPGVEMGSYRSIDKWEAVSANSENRWRAEGSRCPVGKRPTCSRPTSNFLRMVRGFGDAMKRVQKAVEMRNSGLSRQANESQ
ncbi:hypothetical protein OPT61_g7179 [Boeremia exigua]|uniref:Uncharacterized protein n=1 Tax=Boeremia exigua TaxID=749465 RepID=A0ACC2I3A6_9PLEO|nr:hypothetical protein OPT61_g7179 [Boeremia exigua]